MTSSPLQVQVLGPMRIWRDGVEVDPGPHQQTQVLAMLVCRYGRPVGMPELIDALWAESAPNSAANAIHKYIGALRRLLEPGLGPRESGRAILRRGNSYICDLGTEVLDLARFRALVAEARSAAALGEHVEPLDRYREALALWAGPVCEGLTGATTLASVIRPLDVEFFDACRAAADLAMQLGESDRMLPPLRLACAMGPLDEPLHASTMLALDAAGKRAEALTVYDGIRRRLADALGIDPGQALQTAYHRLLGEQTHDPQQSDQVDDRAVAAEPYRVTDFSGRGNEIQAIRSFVTGGSEGARGASALLISGPPGVGKTTTALEALHGVDTASPRLFVNLRGFDSSTLSPVEVLKSLLAQANAGDAPPSTLDEASAAWRAAVEASPVVVLLDNAASESQVRPVLVDGPITVVVTSRRVLAGLESTERMLLGPLPRDESEALLSRLIPAQRRFGADLAALAELCGDLPLALRIAGARIASRPHWSVADFVARLSDERHRLQQLVAGDLGVGSAFSLSFESLDAGARRLFRSLSLLQGRTFSARMAAAIDDMDPMVCRDQLDALADLGLVEVARDERYSLHDLLRLYAGDRLRAEAADEMDEQRDRLDRWVLEMTAGAASTFPNNWAPVPSDARASTDELDAAKKWLTVESPHWHPSLKRAAETGEHRLVVDTTMALRRISSEWWQWGDWAEVHELGAYSAEQVGDEASRVAQLVAAAGFRASDYDDLEGGERATLRALDAAVSWGDPRPIAWANSFLAEYYLALGNWEAALRAARLSAEAFERLGEPTSELANRALVIEALTILDPEAAVGEAVDSLVTVDGQAAGVVKSVDLNNLYGAICKLYLSTQRFEDVLDVAARMKNIPDHELGIGLFTTLALRHSGFALLGLGRLGEARTALEAALSRSHDHPKMEAWAAEIQEKLDSIAR